MMSTATVLTLDPIHLWTVWSWFQDLPAKLKKKLNCEDHESFIASIKGDHKVLVYDDGKLLGYVSCEEKADRVFEAHLFCPRKVPTEKLTQAIDAFFEEVKRDRRIETLLFNVRSRQGRLGQILIESGCIYSGWSYRENGETFRCLFWKKQLS